MLKRGENKSVLNMKRALHRFGVVGNVRSRGINHDGHGGVPFETESKGNARLIFTAMWSPFFFLNVTYCKGCLMLVYM